jgi:hypothetical protein
MNKEEIELIKGLLQEVTQLPVNPKWQVKDGLAFDNKLKLCVDLLNKYSEANKPKQIEDKNKGRVTRGRSKR